jgi:carbon-monoxide dehydrogenase medium subunit
MSLRDHMTTMEYHAPRNIDEAVGLLARTGQRPRVLAGGTDLLVQMRAGRVEPGLLVDVKHIAEMRVIKVDAKGFHIGAAVTGAEMGEHEALQRAWPGVVEATNLIGSTQVQGRATPGGNLCNASPAADSVPAMIAAGAVCIVAHAGGRKEVPVENFVTSPGRNCLGTGEMLVAFRLPARPARSSDAYLRLIPRTEMDIAVVGAGVNLTLNSDGVCSDARVGLGAVAPTPLLVAAAGAALKGTKVDDAALAKAADAARAACKPIDDKRGTSQYRIHVAGVLVQRAARIALERIRNA